MGKKDSKVGKLRICKSNHWSADRIYIILYLKSSEIKIYCRVLHSIEDSDAILT